MEKCPHCNNTVRFKAENKTVGTWGYPFKVISCYSCKSILGTTISDEMQSMIETIHREIKRL